MLVFNQNFIKLQILFCFSRLTHETGLNHPATTLPQLLSTSKKKHRERNKVNYLGEVTTIHRNSTPIQQIDDNYGHVNWSCIEKNDGNANWPMACSVVQKQKLYNFRLFGLYSKYFLEFDLLKQYFWGPNWYDIVIVPCFMSQMR